MLPAFCSVRSVCLLAMMDSTPSSAWSQKTAEHGPSEAVRQRLLKTKVDICMSGCPPNVVANLCREWQCNAGPTFLKLGQILSIRPDVLPPAVMMELAKLQVQFLNCQCRCLATHLGSASINIKPDCPCPPCNGWRPAVWARVFSVRASLLTVAYYT